MFLWVIRGLFVAVWIGIGAFLAYTYPLPRLGVVAMFVGVVMLGGATIGLDVFFTRKRIATISGIFIGLLVGIVLSNFIMLALQPFTKQLELAYVAQNLWESRPIHAGVSLIVTSMMCYLCVSFLLQTKDDFRFIIPYVEFTKETKGVRPLLLDTSVIIDGRIADLAETKTFDNPLVVPGFVLQELQAVADSSDKLKRNRGRRGLDILNRLRASPNLDLQTNETDLPEFQNIRGVDQRLVILAKHLNAKVMTNDFNLNKVARVQGVDVVNLNDVANSLKPVFLPGELIQVRLTKVGDQPGQGVGYLDDGTMVVAEQGRNYIGEEVKLVVTSVLQTSAGRMIFGKLDGPLPKQT